MSLDAKDWRILQELDIDVRQSAAQIGRTVRLSKEVVQYRIQRLLTQGILTGFWAVPRIGTSIHVYKLLLKNRSLDRETKERFISYCLENKAVSWLAQTEGNWDFVISSYVTDDVFFSEFVSKLFENFGTYFGSKQITKATGMVLLNEKYLYDDNATRKIVENSFLEMSPETDERDMAIIRMLANNARISFVDMARELDITPEAVSARYRKIMKERLIVGMNPRINHSLLGLGYYHLFVSISDYAIKDQLIKFYSEHPHCVFIMKHIGCYDLHLELVMRHDLVEGFIDELTGKFGNQLSSYELLHIQKEHIMIVTR